MKKKKIKKIMNVTECLRCGEPIDKHHFFCNDCYVPGLIHSKEFRNKKKRLKKQYMKEHNLKPLT